MVSKGVRSLRLSEEMEREIELCAWAEGLSFSQMARSILRSGLAQRRAARLGTADDAAILSELTPPRGHGDKGENGAAGTLDLDDDTRDALEQQAQAEGVDLSELLNDLLKDAVASRKARKGSG